MTSPDTGEPQTVATIDEWIDYTDATDEPKAQAIGVLADEIRQRFGAKKHVPVSLTEVTEYSGCADGCCNDTDQWLAIDCGDEQTRLYFYGDPRERYRDWLDEPRRWAEKAAAEQARKAKQREQSARFDTQVVAPIRDAMEAVDAEGYRDDQEWHDKLMGRLGVRGYRS